MSTRYTKVTIRKNLDPNKTVNTEDGQTIGSEHPGSDVRLHTPTDVVKMKYPTFIVTSSVAMRVVREHYSRPEVDRISQMTDMTNDKTNVLKQEDNVPHSTETLMEALNYNKNAFYIFMRKLIYHDIVHVTIRNVNERIIKTIVLNPYLSCRSKIKLELAETFKDISKGLNRIVIEDLQKFPTKVNA